MREINDIWHGDSVELCKRFQPKRQVNCVITDPPFGVNNVSRAATSREGIANVRKIANDANVDEATTVFNNVMDSLLPATVDNSDLYIFTSYQVLEHWLGVARDLARHDFHQKALLVWEKDGPGMGDLEYWGMGLEFILYLKKGRRPRSANAPRRNAVLHFPQVRPNELIHPHEKPVPLISELIRFSTDPGDFIVDPFCGSAATMRASKQQGRNSIGIELDEDNFKKSHAKLHTSADELL